VECYDDAVYGIGDMDFDEDYICYVESRIHEAIPFASSRRLDDDGERKRVSDFYGIEIIVVTGGTLRRTSLDSLVLHLICFAIVMGIPRRIVKFFANTCCGKVSNFYAGVSYQAFTLQQCVPAITAKAVEQTQLFKDLDDVSAVKDQSEVDFDGGISLAKLRVRFHQLIQNYYRGFNVSSHALKSCINFGLITAMRMQHQLNVRFLHKADIDELDINDVPGGEANDKQETYELYRMGFNRALSKARGIGDPDGISYSDSINFQGHMQAFGIWGSVHWGHLFWLFDKEVPRSKLESFFTPSDLHPDTLHNIVDRYRHLRAKANSKKGGMQDYADHMSFDDFVKVARMFGAGEHQNGEEIPDDDRGPGEPQSKAEWHIMQTQHRIQKASVEISDLPEDVRKLQQKLEKKRREIASNRATFLKRRAKTLNEKIAALREQIEGIDREYTVTESQKELMSADTENIMRTLSKDWRAWQSHVRITDYQIWERIEDLKWSMIDASKAEEEWDLLRAAEDLISEQGQLRESASSSRAASKEKHAILELNEQPDKVIKIVSI